MALKKKGTMAYGTLDALPEDCLAHIISFTSPHVACQSSLVSTVFRGAAGSDLVWRAFLPSDCDDMIAKSVVPVEFSSKKDLFIKLSTPLLIDGGKKSFSLDKCTCKKCYMLSARELSITWSTNPLYWCWKPISSSRFPQAVELIMVCRLEIHGKINTQVLSSNTTYGVYLVVQLSDRAFGLDSLPSEVSIEVGEYKSRGSVYIRRDKCKKQQLISAFLQHRIDLLRSRVWHGDDSVLHERGDGWLEAELGEFYTDGNSNKEVKMSFREIEGEHLKGGLVVEGIEIRPKH